MHFATFFVDFLVVHREWRFKITCEANDMKFTDHLFAIADVDFVSRAMEIDILSLFLNIRYFCFVKQMYLHIF
jgi:hypothetical protein